MLHEDVAFGERDQPAGNVKVLAERRTDKLSPRLNRANKTLEVMTRAGVGIGCVDPGMTPMRTCSSSVSIARPATRSA
jgi:hypothetical protein